jgi:hypothetical protein
MTPLLKLSIGCAVFALCVASLVRGLWGVFFELTRRRCSCGPYQGCDTCGRYRRREGKS